MNDAQKNSGCAAGAAEKVPGDPAKTLRDLGWVRGPESSSPVSGAVSRLRDSVKRFLAPKAPPNL